MTGQDRIRAAFKNKDSFEFEPVWKAILATNHLPEIRGQGHAIWRRPKVLRFEVVIPDQRQDLDLWPKLDVEAAGVLNWALTGCYEWQRGGLQVPEDVVKATATYRDDQDELKDWITERCIVDPSRSDRFRTLFVDYVAWCKRAEQKPMGSKSFAQALNERQFVAKHTKHGDFRIGLAVQTSPQQGEIGESSVSDEASTKLGETSQGHFSGFRESPHAHARKPENNGHQVSPLTEEPEFDHAAERWHVAGRPIDETAWLERAEVKYLVEVTR
jgi:phage/plasmid-associated DNA primase